ncbi:hypothetical protein N329_04681, partial [Haliaeetus albicilla]
PAPLGGQDSPYGTELPGTDSVGVVLVGLQSCVKLLWQSHCMFLFLLLICSVLLVLLHLFFHFLLQIRWHHKLIFWLHLGWSSKIACLFLRCLCGYFNEVEALLQGHYGAIGQLLSIETACGKRFLQFTLFLDPSLHSVAVYTILSPNDKDKPRVIFWPRSRGAVL